LLLTLEKLQQPAPQTPDANKQIKHIGATAIKSPFHKAGYILSIKTTMWQFSSANRFILKAHYGHANGGYTSLCHGNKATHLI
jgi:hypothetical protein